MPIVTIGIAKVVTLSKGKVSNLHQTNQSPRSAACMCGLMNSYSIHGWPKTRASPVGDVGGHVVEEFTHALSQQIVIRKVEVPMYLSLRCTSSNPSDEDGRERCLGLIDCEQSGGFEA